MSPCRHPRRRAGGAGPHTRHVWAPQTVREAGCGSGLPYPAVSTGTPTPTGPMLALLRLDPSSQQAPCPEHRAPVPSRVCLGLGLSRATSTSCPRGSARLSTWILGHRWVTPCSPSPGSRPGSRFRTSDTHTLRPAARAPPAGANAFGWGRARGSPCVAARTGPRASEGTQESPPRVGPAWFGLD